MLISGHKYQQMILLLHMINKEFTTWFKEQECYPFVQGWRLKQSLCDGAKDYRGRTTVKQALDEE